MTSSGGAAEKQSYKMGIYEKGEGLVWKHSSPGREEQIYVFSGLWHIGDFNMETYTSDRGIESTTVATLDFESLNWRYWNGTAKTWNDDDTFQVRASGPY